MSAAALVETTLVYREDRWWSLLDAVGRCVAVARWSAPDTVVAYVDRSRVNDDYWSVGVEVGPVVFHTTVDRGVVRDALVTVHDWSTNNGAAT